MSILFVSHDLPSVYTLCHRIALIDAGEIVECNTPQAIFFSPAHPFTRKLLAALPSIPAPLQVASKPALVEPAVVIH
jgi:peptide/nickel transport system ATP-binding protein